MRITSKKRAFPIVDNILRSGVLVIGDIMADRFIRGRGFPGKVVTAAVTREELKKII